MEDELLLSHFPSTATSAFKSLPIRLPVKILHFEPILLLPFLGFTTEKPMRRQQQRVAAEGGSGQYNWSTRN